MSFHSNLVVIFLKRYGLLMLSTHLPRAVWRPRGQIHAVRKLSRTDNKTCLAKDNAHHCENSGKNY